MIAQTRPALFTTRIYYSPNPVKNNLQYNTASLNQRKAIRYCKAGLDLYKLFWVVLKLVCGIRDD